MQSDVNKGSKSGAKDTETPGAVFRSRRMSTFARHIPPRSADTRNGKVRERSVPLRGRLTKDAGACYIARFLVLAAEDPKRPIIAYVSSSGGIAAEALAVISTMNGIRCPIATFCSGAVTGPAIAIAVHGKKGFRTATPTAQFSFGGFELQGVSQDAAGNDSLLAVFAENMARDTGNPPAKVVEWVRKGAEFNAEEALKHGLIDTIAPGPNLPESPERTI